MPPGDIPPVVRSHLHAIQAVQDTLDSSTDLGLNCIITIGVPLIIVGADDPLGGGSVQDSLGIAGENTSSSGKPMNIAGARDAPFWEALGGIPNLHAIISGHAHGNEWCAREPGLGVRFCFNKHSGYGGYDKAGWGHGARNVMFSLSPTGDSTEGTVLNAETWIQLESGE
ncbi:hypothetical protein B0H16DRAFT_1573977 [Mycena metata]|uniref:Calcineurin-like phosphoesterase domain-containing protein n=1 Tax=Mycena metata TaxID=1033252 RepID=A0AAD7I8N4_9AGAR|nr:hypothetical protein B0H16DRAFT_1573977 [Mycena metata]